MAKQYDLTITTPETFADCCAQVLYETIAANPKAVIGLSTGRTTGNIHRKLAALVKENGIDVSGVTIFGLDEVTGVSVEYFGSCIWMLQHECVDDMGIPAENFLMLPVESDDWERDCAAFTSELEKRGGITLLELGLGEKVHIGFNQPGTPFSQRAFRGMMHDYLEERIRRETGTPADKELGGVTLGIADVMESGKILLCVNGENKREILRKTLYGPVTEDIPATVLQSHPNLQIISDSLAHPAAEA